MPEEIRFVSELHCDQLPSQRLGHISTFGKRLLQRASAKVQAIDASPAGRG